MQARAHAQVHGATRRARESATTLRQLDRATKDKVLRALAEALMRQASDILEANDLDLNDAPDPYALAAHLVVTEDRLEELAYVLRMLAAAPDPIGQIVRGSRQRSGMQLCQVRVPIGVLAVLFEDPTMLLRSAAMLLKTGNAVVLHHPGSEVPRTEAIFLQILREVMETHGIPADSAQLLCDAHRATIRYLLGARGEIDLVIPVLARPIAAQLRVEATVPIADIGAGNCHVYVDAAADIPLAIKVVLESKVPFTPQPRAAEQVLVHTDIAATFIPLLTQALAAHDIEVHVDDRTARFAPGAAIAESASWRCGYGTLDLGCAVVDSLGDAITHINRYGNGHTEAVVTSDAGVAQRFSASVDAGMVTVNAATTFPHTNANPMDPELAFATHRLAPRGPLTLTEFTSTKWVAWPVGLEFSPLAEAYVPSDTHPPPRPGVRAGSAGASVQSGEPPPAERSGEAGSVAPVSRLSEADREEFDQPLIPTQRGRGAHAAPEPDRGSRLPARG
jgi:glutamate-5-semialdehyde dehydrogenase